MSDAKLLAAIERSETEQLQISISEYKGKSYLNMRIFYTTDGGSTWLPTKKGVTLLQISLICWKKLFRTHAKNLWQKKFRW